jgi:hypothetical protein
MVRGGGLGRPVGQGDSPAAGGRRLDRRNRRAYGQWPWREISSQSSTPMRPFKPHADQGFRQSF